MILEFSFFLFILFHILIFACQEFEQMFFSWFILINIQQILSIKIGQIPYASITSNSSIYRSLTPNCTDCLCDCFNSVSCLGINCFPLNQTCQLIEQQPWIFESDVSFNSTSNNFVQITTNNSRFCSCYTPENILNYFGQINSTDSSPTMNMRLVQYISNDETLIVLNNSLIQKLSANNLGDIRRNLSVSSNDAMSILHNDTNIYIAFAVNRSINMFDLNLTLLKTSISWSNQSGLFGKILLFNNQILIMDYSNSIIWSINSLNQYNLTQFFNLSSYNISNPYSLFIYQNHTLYISNASRYFYVFNLTNFTLKQTFFLSIDISLMSMRYDSNCNRLWFGTQNYTYAPVFDLASNQMNIYPTRGMISKSGIYSIDFNENYTVFYADTGGYVRRIYLPDINC
jgi:hypothetical protein